MEEYCLGAWNPGWKESGVVDRCRMHHRAHLVCMAVGFGIIGEFIPQCPSILVPANPRYARSYWETVFQGLDSLYNVIVHLQVVVN